MLKLFPPGGNAWGLFQMALPEKYHLAADDANVLACYAAIRPLYDQYSALDIAEAHYQIRKELDMIKEIEEKKKRIRALKAELESEDIPE